MNKLISKKRNLLEQLELKIISQDPKRILELGYAIVRKDNKVLMSSENLKQGDIVHTQLRSGKFTSKII